MSGSRDPVERAADRSRDLYDVSMWEPRTTVDKLSTKVYVAIVYATRWLPILVSGLLLYYEFRVGLDSAVVDPTVRMLVALSILPAFVLAAFIWRSDITRDEPLSLLLTTFLLAIVLGPFAGVLNVLVPVAFLALVAALFFAASGASLPATLTSVAGDVVADAGTFVSGLEAGGTQLLADALQQFGGLTDLGLLFYIPFFYLVVGPVEEAVKLLAVRLHAYRKKEFDAVVDGAVYGAVAGLGFATVENALYITSALEVTGQSVTLFGPGGIAAVRALAGPGHVIYSAIAGYYLGLAKFNRRWGGPIVVKGVLIAAFFHGTYNVTVGIVPGLLTAAVPEIPDIVAFVAFIVVYDGAIGLFLYRKIRRYRQAYRAVGAAEPREGDLLAELTEFDAPNRASGGGRRGQTGTPRRGGTEERSGSGRQGQGGYGPQGRGNQSPREQGRPPRRERRDHRWSPEHSGRQQDSGRSERSDRHPEASDEDAGAERR